LRIAEFRSARAHSKTGRTVKTKATIVLLASLFLVAGCDWGARWDLMRAEKLLKECDRLNAEFWDEKDYRKAQKLFDEAVDLARERRINEARDKAAEAKDWAEEAIMWAKVRAAEMEEEKARVHSKKL